MPLNQSYDIYIAKLNLKIEKSFFYYYFFGGGGGVKDEVTIFL